MGAPHSRTWMASPTSSPLSSQAQGGIRASKPNEYWHNLLQLDTFATLERLIAFYVEQYNTVVPHSAFVGQTPDEMYFGGGDQVPVELAAGRARAREARMKSNRELSCEACRPAIREMPGTSDSSAIPGVLPMHQEMSAMS
jgi:hypothetical protein